MREQEAKKKSKELKVFPVPFPFEKLNKNICIDSYRERIHSKQRLINEKIESNVLEKKPNMEKLRKKAIDLHLKGKINEAIKYYKYLIVNGYKNHKVYSNYGLIMQSLGKLNEAEIYTRKAIKINPQFAEAYSNLGIILRKVDKYKEAEISIKKALKIKPIFPEANFNLGLVLRELKKLKEAELVTKRAIRYKSDYAEAYCNLGAILNDLGEFEEAINSLELATKIKPNSEEIIHSFIIILKSQGKLKESLEIIEEFLQKNPNNESILVEFLDIASSLSELDKIQNYLSDISSLGTKRSACDPMKLLHLEDNPKSHLLRAINYNRKYYQAIPKNIAYRKKNKVHVGYFSADFNSHPVMHLFSRIIELYDSSKFRIYLYSFCIKEDENTKYIKNKVDYFRDIKDLTNSQAVEIARSDDLDIAIDLMGYTKNNRMGIFSNRVAPIQINYLGFPSTTGSEQIDYLISDEIIIPEKNKKYFTEKIVYLPNSYMPFNNKKNIPINYYSRNDFNLPNNAFVLAAFHKNRKITLKEIESWSRILNSLQDSILWINDSNKSVKLNLLKYFNEKGIDKERIYFAKRMNTIEEHLSRHSCADIFLDTFFYNAHSTAIDSLWAELPVVTLMGESFASRVGGSLLTNLGLSELIAHNVDQYEEIVINLGNNTEKLSLIKRKLQSSKTSSNLFNSNEFTKDLENLYLKLIKNEET